VKSPFDDSEEERKKSIGATICIGQEIICLPYVAFLNPISQWQSYREPPCKNKVTAT
jgi:hypothetical protein